MGITYTLPNIALLKKLQWLANAANANEIAGGLFVSPTSISDTLSFGFLTQPSFPGYSVKVPGPGTAVGSSTSTIATNTFTAITFTCTAAPATPVTIQGTFYVMNYPTTDLLAIALLPNGPKVISQPGDSVVSQLQLTEQRAPGQP